jgi:hypothetical protein
MKKTEIDNTESTVANQFLLGFVLAVIIPIFTIIIFNISLKRNMTLDEFLQNMMQLKVLSSLLSLAGLPNLALFFIFLNLKKFKTVKGILAATLFLAILVFIVKLFF